MMPSMRSIFDDVLVLPARISSNALTIVLSPLSTCAIAASRMSRELSVTVLRMMPLLYPMTNWSIASP
jgi:hypothetical protein